MHETIVAHKLKVFLLFVQYADPPALAKKPTTYFNFSLKLYINQCVKEKFSDEYMLSILNVTESK